MSRMSLFTAFALAFIWGCSSDEVNDTVAPQPSTYTIEIEIAPESLQAPWTLFGPDGYRYAGFGEAMVADVTDGDYTIQWGAVEGWNTPSPSQVVRSVGPGSTVLFQGSYVRQLGEIVIDVNPDDAGATWNLIGPDGFRIEGSGDRDVLDLEPGSYTLSLSAGLGWEIDGQAAMNAHLDHGERLTFAANYTRRFEPFVIGNGPSVSESSDEIVLRMPSHSADSAEAPVFAAGCRTLCSFTGDFDVQVDYRLVDWPNANGVRFGLGVISDGTARYGVTQRTSFGGAPHGDFPSAPPESYVFQVGSSRTISAALQNEGTLRIVRQGSVWSGFYADDGEWVMLASYSGPTDAISLEIVAWSHDYAFNDEDVAVSFHDFRVNSSDGCVGSTSSRSGQLRERGTIAK